MAEEQRYIGEPFTVGTLREKLGEYPAQTPVVIARDEEGNGFEGFLQVQVDDEGVLVIWPTEINGGRHETPDEAVAEAKGFASIRTLARGLDVTVKEALAMSDDELTARLDATPVDDIKARLRS